MEKTAFVRLGAIGDIIMGLNFASATKKFGGTFFCGNDAYAMIHDFVCNYAGLELRPHSEYREDNFDRTVSLIGYPIYDGYPYKPMKKHLLQYFADEMSTDFTFDGIKATLPPLPKIFQRDKFPSHITIQTKTGWSIYKDWWGWSDLVDLIHKEIPDILVCQIGGPSDPKAKNIDINLCGDSFTNNLAAQAWAKLHIGLDSVFNHTTNIIWAGKGRTPSVIIFGSTQASASGYPSNINLSLGLQCQPCFRENPSLSRIPLGVCINPPEQDYDNPKHACMAGITPRMVIDAVKKLLGRA